MGVYIPHDVRLSPPPTPSQRGEHGSDGTLTCRYSPGVKPIAEQGTSSYACSFKEDCISPPHAVFIFSLSSNSERGGASLAEHRAATVLQCWKRRIWLCLLKQKRLRLQSLCRGASTYASSVWGNRHSPPTPAEKTSDPKDLRHPFRTHGQPLPLRKRGRRHKRPRCRPGRRHRPRAPDSGGGPLCMPLIFWATQTIAASNLLGVEDINITSYISPISAASTIQYAYRHHIIRRNCRIIPCLRVTEKWAADSNAYYRSTLASMYQKWAHLPFAALVSYLTNFRRLHFTSWPHMSWDYETMLREYEVREILLMSHGHWR